MRSSQEVSMLHGDTGAKEISRIRAEYERRSQVIPRDFYSWGRISNYFLDTQLIRHCIAELKRKNMFPLEGKSVADIGCGSGRWLLEFAQWEATDIHGIELDELRLERARKRLPSADLWTGDARYLPWQDGAFDLVSQFTLFSSILDGEMKRRIAAEMVRVAKPGGIILWFDFRVNNPRNPNVRGIAASEIRALFPDCQVRLCSTTLAPPIARIAAPVSWVAATFLETIPFLRTHYLGIIEKSAHSS